MAANMLATQLEIEEFNQTQTAKIIQIKQKRLEKENAKKKAMCQIKNMFFSICVVFFFASVFGAVIFQNSLVNEAKYNLFNLRNEIKSIEARIEEVEANLERHTELQNIEVIAKEQLNMQYPVKEQIVYINAATEYKLNVAEGETSEPLVSARQEASEPSFRAFIGSLLKSN
ncbi:hypothetical protein [Fusibacter tunisiensis]|jgi:hypothetical protein|uniref:Cell division protein FtsL n=1 Tax=Fusibacter tunisiensis TaxID=1008308 RepID=A0ABS2MM71_9FIRM|nr:hypothetical protein [Fusibacter tunisiensis]MBM7560495.1 cell division protein FtsL [Fusibacter tunisiensis]